MNEEPNIDEVLAAVDAQVEHEAVMFSVMQNKLNAISKEFVLEALDKDEDGDSALFTELFKDQICYDHAEGAWYCWEGHYWKQDRTEKVISFLDEVIDRYRDALVKQAWLRGQAAKQGDKEREQACANTEKKLSYRIHKLQEVKRKQNVFRLARTDKYLGISGDEWDKNPYVLGCLNGVIDLKTGQLRPGEPKDYIKTVCPTLYKGAEEPAPLWEKTLLEIFNNLAELIDFIRRTLGYGLIGAVIEHVLIIFYGAGRNGKGLLQETIADVLGDLAAPIQAEFLLEQSRFRSSASPSPDIMSLRGRRIVWGSETNEDRDLNAGKTKCVVGGDTLVGRPPYGKYEIAFKPTHLLILLTNNKPHVSANDYALWARLRLVPFLMQFVDDPKADNERKRDPMLKDKLLQERSGILAWMVRGCLEWQRHGLNPPAVVLQAISEYRNEEDVTKHFLDDCCELSDTVEIQASNLFKGYAAWCRANGHKPVNGTKFGKEIKKKFGFASFKNTYVYYRGIKLNDEWENKINGNSF